MSLLDQTRQKSFIALQQALPQHWVSRMTGKLAASRIEWIKNTLISNFAQHYQIDMSIAAEENLRHYASFNDFFTRALKPGVRPVHADSNSVVSPADGQISQIGTITGDQVFQAKGQHFSASQLLGSEAAAQPFQNGQFATVYLSPRDYHRVHMPFDGRLRETLYIPGELFSVNGTTAEHVQGLFARNERMVCLFDVPHQGKTRKMAVVLVGALIVAGIETVATGKAEPNGSVQQQFHDLFLAKGAELGRFYLGSTAIVLFEPNMMDWQNDQQANGLVTMGQLMGRLR